MKSWLTRMLMLTVLALVPACGSDDDGGGPDAATGPDAGGNGVPQITKITWAPVGDCHTGTASDYSIDITAVDSNTAADQLTFTGTVSSCMPNITMAVQTINCPNLGTYSGMVTVKDPENNESMKTFNISPCSPGMVE